MAGHCFQQKTNKQTKKNAWCPKPNDNVSNYLANVDHLAAGNLSVIYRLCQVSYKGRLSRGRSVGQRDYDQIIYITINIKIMITYFNY